MMTLAQALSKHGWDVGVISAGTFGQHALDPEWFESQGVQHFRLAYDSRNPLTLFAQALKTLRVVRQFKPDLLHVHWRITSAFAQLAQMVLKIPFVSTIHLLGIGEGRFHQLFSYWGQRAIAISSECRDYLEHSFNLPPQNIDLIFNGADAHYFRIPSAGERNQARAMFGAADESCVISLTGRLEEVKGHTVLLNAIAPLIKNNSNVELLFAGEGSQKANLISLSEKLGIAQHVHFLGHTDAREVLWASDISVLPSFKEGFPLSTVESMLCGVVTVRSNTSGAADVITQGETGFIVPIGDAETLGDCLSKLINSPTLRKTLSDNARLQALERFTSEIMTTQTISTYERVLNQSSRPSTAT